MSDNYVVNMQESTVVELADKAWIGLVTTMTKSYVEKGVPLIRNSDIKEGYVRTERMINLDPAFAEFHSGRTVKTGDIVSVHTGDIATSAVIKDELNGAHGFATINTRVDSKRIDNQYLCYFFNSEYFKYQAYGVITGDGRDNLNLKEFLELKVLYPKEIEQQQKIAKILSTVDNLIEKTQTLIDKYTAIKQGMMADLFTRGIDMTTGDIPNSKGGKLRPSVEDAPELYKQTELGWVPKEWEVKKANDICLAVIDCKNRTPPETEEGFIVLKTFNIKQGGLKYERLTFTDAESYETWTERGEPQAGDIVITREAPIGESFLIDKDMPKMCLGQRMMLYRPDSSKIEPAFMYYVTRTEALQRRLIELAGGSTVGHVKVGDIRDLLFLVPPVSEQVSIAKKLGVIDSKLGQEEKYLEKLNKQKKGLMQDLLTGKVKV